VHNTRSRCRDLVLRAVLLSGPACSNTAGDLPDSARPSVSIEARPGPADDSWRLYRRVPGGAQVDLPGEPETQESLTGEFPTHTATIRKKHWIFLFSELELPPDRRPDEAFEAFVASAPAHLTEKFSNSLATRCSHDEPRRLSLHAMRAAEFVVSCGATAASRVRLAYGGDRAFQLIVSSLRLNGEGTPP
jgi:hypothetical protein